MTRNGKAVNFANNILTLIWQHNSTNGYHCNVINLSNSEHFGVVVMYWKR